VEENEIFRIIQSWDRFGGILTESHLEEIWKRIERKLLDVFENAGDGLIIFDKHLRLIFANKKCEEMTGFSRTEYLGRPLIDLVPEKWRFKLMKAHFEVLKDKTVRVELKVKNAEGRSVPVEVTAVPIKENGEIIAIFSIVREISERKALERKLRRYSFLLKKMLRERIKELEEIKKRYSTLVEQANDGVVITQKNGKLIFANRKIEEILNYNKNEILGKHFTKFIASEYLKLVKERFQKRISGTEAPQIYEIKLLSKNNERIPVEINAALIDHEGEPAVLVVIRDVRERKALEEHVLKTQRLEAIRQLATMVAHDLRNPLAGIRNAAYYMKMKLKNVKEPTLKEALEIIDREVVFANGIVNDLLDFASDKPLELKKINVNTVMEKALFLTQIPENIKVIKKLSPLPKIYADANRIHRVFKNIVENAVQAMPKGGELSIQTRVNGNFIEVMFKDTGVGISKENMKKLFTPFFTTKSKGMGIGLTICKKFVEDHGGKIEVQSKEGKGAVFTVKLPVKRAEGGEKSE